MKVERFYRAALRAYPTYGKALYNLATWLHTLVANEQEAVDGRATTAFTAPFAAASASSSSLRRGAYGMHGGARAAAASVLLGYADDLSLSADILDDEDEDEDEIIEEEDEDEDEDEDDSPSQSVHAVVMSEAAELYRRAIMAAPALLESYTNLAALLLSEHRRAVDRDHQSRRADEAAMVHNGGGGGGGVGGGGVAGSGSGSGMSAVTRRMRAAAAAERLREREQRGPQQPPPERVAAVSEARQILRYALQAFPRSTGAWRQAEALMPEAEAAWRELAEQDRRFKQRAGK